MRSKEFAYINDNKINMNSCEVSGADISLLQVRYIQQCTVFFLITEYFSSLIQVIKGVYIREKEN